MITFKIKKIISFFTLYFLLFGIISPNFLDIFKLDYKVIPQTNAAP